MVQSPHCRLHAIYEPTVYLRGDSERNCQWGTSKNPSARGGQIIDATIVSVPKQRNTKEENEAIKAGKTPEGWEQQPAKNAQKDKDARWTKKNDASFYGYKNHLGVDKAHKLIRKWDATDAAVHDSQKLDDVLDLSNTGKGVWADSAYRSVQIEAGLKEKGLQSRIHRRAGVTVRCQRARSRRTRRARRYAPVSSTYSASSRARWAARSCAPSASRGRGSRSGDEPGLRHPSVGSARADGACARLSALTGGVRVSCKRPARRQSGPDRGPTLARAPQPLAQRKQGIVRGPLLYMASMRHCRSCLLKAQCCPKAPFRRVPRSIYEEARDVARALAKTEAFERSRHVLSS